MYLRYSKRLEMKFPFNNLTRFCKLFVLVPIKCYCKTANRATLHELIKITVTIELILAE